MKKQSLSRAAVLLSASALTFGLTATTAAAAEPLTPRPTSTFTIHNAGPGNSVGVAAGVAKDHNRKIDRLRKALDTARAERADAHDTATAARIVVSDTAGIVYESKTALASATETARQAKADLAQSRTRLDTTRTTLKEATTLRARNRDEQTAAQAAITLAETARETTTTTITDLTAAMPTLLADAAAADQAVVDAETEIATLTNTTIPQATTNTVTTQMQANAVATQTSNALAVYTNQTYAYNGGCFPQSDGLVYCLDNTGVWAVRGEATDMWGTYLTLRAQWEAAQVVADDAAAALTAAQVDLTQWNTERTNRVAAATAAQEAIDTAEADRVAAEATVVAATATIAEQTDLLDTLVAEVGPLAENLTTADTEEKAAATVHDQHAATHTTAATALNRATDVYENVLDSQERAQQTLDQSYRTLAAAREHARRVQNRLAKARAHNR